MELGPVITCNCSRCQKLGSVLAFVQASDFALRSGANDLSDFEFNVHAIHHLFCSTCGIQSFARGTAPNGDEIIVINNVDGRSF